ncbi:DddA-like double-stranded DNA deaminase toxin [Amycolatopsis sp. NPDC051372]|uniref:DddA-like double-stranded DNA deaminase toxin n=1 Tax=unclassified Amycolatopsis TaxID=2618356 RepID=UPI003418AAD0
MTGQKTHGRRVDEHGQAHEIVSGNDADAAEAARLLREKGIPQRGDETTTADVEQKIAARMVREGRKHVDIVRCRPWPNARFPAAPAVACSFWALDRRRASSSS